MVNNKIINVLIIISTVVLTFGCSDKTTIDPVDPIDPVDQMQEDSLVEGVDYFLPNIDLNNWKVTLPIGDPTEVEPPEILDYANNSLLQNYMYNDSLDGSLVFYTTPDATTANSSYSRTELREQMVPGSNSTNWTFAQGGRLKGELALSDISTKNNGDFDRTMVMQIHGRLTNAQRDEIGEDDNNAPPILKVYWNDNRVRVLRKILKDVNTPYPEILKKESWTDEGFWFDERVSNDKFTIEIIVDATTMKVVLNDNEEMLFDDIHIEKWGIFENYFKAGNYLQTSDKDAFSTVKYYSLDLTH